MGDFPVLPPLPLFVNSFCQYGPLAAARAGFGLNTVTSLGSQDWGGANTAAYLPFWLPWPYPVNRVFWANGATVAGNVDFGIYTAGGARIYSTGSTAASGASVLQFVTPSTPFILNPGAYFMAYVNDGTTTRAFGTTLVTAALGRGFGLFQQASALPLPAAATFAQWAMIGVPLCGFTLTTTGF